MDGLRRILVLTTLTLATLLRAADAPASAAPASGVPAGPIAEPETLPDGRLKVGFDYLASYVFTPPQFDPTVPPGAPGTTGEEQIPPGVKALHGRKVVITGYMVPVRMDKGLVTEFLLMRNTLACCFGGVPNMNEWLVVKMPNGVAPLLDTPLHLEGTLKVAAIFENGYLTGLYEMAAERLSEAKP